VNFAAEERAFRRPRDLPATARVEISTLTTEPPAEVALDALTLAPCEALLLRP
jgi:hypothetical protein